MISKSLPDETTVLVVGAGPAGLSCALSLLGQGCSDIVVVDALAAGENSSRAVTVHAATLEALHTVGCADSLVRVGVTSPTMTVYSRHTMRMVMQSDFASLEGKTRFPFALVLPQSTTERVLLDHLAERGVQVYRPYEVVGMKDAENGIEVSFSNGETIKAKYAVGADGARSAVRNLAGIGFPIVGGQQMEDNNVGRVALADVVLDTASTSLPRKLTGFITPDSAFYMMPQSLDNVGMYRLAFGLAPNASAPPKTPSIPYLQDLLNKCGPNPPPRISHVIASSRYRVRCCVAETFFTRLDGPDFEHAGIVLLIGDAGHIHSPAGGQGMNLSIRDGITLGRALAAHLKQSQASPSAPGVDAVLTNWAEIRRTNAYTTIAKTKMMASIMGSPKPHPVVGAIFQFLPFSYWDLRTWAMSMAMRIGYVKHALAFRLSGLGDRKDII
ncbi:hypothetical protein PLICRDRAFT_110804 [Plicaturopsis crispa FD-325 SS-3]|nr:hypothetical protein PLICRDRAFT_110804 [Plicaturopsis crispa FD-325 SS-3]